MGFSWWNLPWEQMESYLIYDLEEIPDNGNWRFERHWNVEQAGDISMLLLKERGHCSIFSKDAYFDENIESVYTPSEIDSKMRDLNKKMLAYDLVVYGMWEGGVHSLLTGAHYDSGADYLLSAEHLLRRDYIRDSYAKSLYTKHETTTVCASSQSIDYECLLAVAEYRIDENGVLNHVGMHNYSICDSRGRISTEMIQHYEKKDSAISCAAFLSDHPSVKSVPLQLFGKDLLAGASNYSEAMRQAELYTCLSGKISVE